MVISIANQVQTIREERDGNEKIRNSPMSGRFWTPEARRSLPCLLYSNWQFADVALDDDQAEELRERKARPWLSNRCQRSLRRRFAEKRPQCLVQRLWGWGGLAASPVVEMEGKKSTNRDETKAPISSTSGTRNSRRWSSGGRRSHLSAEGNQLVFGVKILARGSQFNLLSLTQSH